MLSVNWKLNAQDDLAEIVIKGARLELDERDKTASNTRAISIGSD